MRYLFVAIFGLLLLASPTSAGPEKSSGVVLGDAILAELPSVGLLVESVSADANTIGVTVDLIRTKVELVLRKYRVPTRTAKKPPAAPGSPYLCVKVDVVGRAYAVTVELREQVGLKRRSAWTMATTWQTSRSGTHYAPYAGDVVLNRAMLQVEKFALAWRKQNPKKQSPKK